MLTDRRLLALLFLPLFAFPASASSIPCGPRAAASHDGRFLIVLEEETEPKKDEPGVNQTTRITMNIFPQEDFQVTTPMTFWANSGPLWTTVLEPSKIKSLPDCPIPLISDNAEYIVLLLIIDDFDPRNKVMQIYRRPSNTVPRGNGVFVKELTLGEIWPEHKFQNEGMNTGTPLWFEGGTFDWGKNSYSLIYKTQWGDSIRIDLNTGSFSKEPGIPSATPQTPIHR
jgi:hypothetical protein